MFNTTKTLVFITKNSVRAAQVEYEPSPVVKQRIDYSRSGETLETLLVKIKSQFGPHIRIVLSDEFVYTVSIKKTTDVVSRDEVKQLAQEYIPEDLAQTMWDFKINVANIQVVAVKKSVHDELTAALQKTGITNEAVEPCSAALARLMATEKDPVLIIYSEDVTVLAAVSNGLVITAQVIHDTITPTIVRGCINFANERATSPLKTIIFSGTIKPDAIDTEQFKDLSIQTKDIDPFLSVIEKDDTANVTGTPANSTAGRKILIVIALIGVVGIASAIGFYRILSNTKSTVQGAAPVTQTPTQPVATATATLIPTPVLDKSDYKISILNGNGIPGEATRLSNLLKKEGYTIAATGNAPQSNHVETSIRYYSTVPKNILNELDNYMKTFYDTVINEPKIASDEADITIIIGTPKP